MKSNILTNEKPRYVRIQWDSMEIKIEFVTTPMARFILFSKHKSVHQNYLMSASGTFRVAGKIPSRGFLQFFRNDKLCSEGIVDFVLLKREFIEIGSKDMEELEE